MKGSRTWEQFEFFVRSSDDEEVFGIYNLLLLCKSSTAYNRVGSR